MAESSSLASVKTIFVFPFGGEKWQIGEVYRESESLLEQRSYSNETRLEAAL
jgi:hypothetical protein